MKLSVPSHRGLEDERCHQAGMMVELIRGKEAEKSTLTWLWLCVEVPPQTNGRAANSPPDLRVRVVGGSVWT